MLLLRLRLRLYYFYSLPDGAPLVLFSLFLHPALRLPHLLGIQTLVSSPPPVFVVPSGLLAFSYILPFRRGALETPRPTLPRSKKPTTLVKCSVTCDILYAPIKIKEPLAETRKSSQAKADKRSS